MTFKNKSHPSICLRRGNRFPSTSMSVKFVLDDRTFIVANSNEDFEALFQEGQNSRMTSRGQWLFMEFETSDVWLDFNTVHAVTALMSLLTRSMYFDNTLTGPHVYPGYMVHNLSDLPIPKNFEEIRATDKYGISPDLAVSNDEVARTINSYGSLNEEDRGRVRSAASLMRDAKSQLFRGEDSAAVTSAVSAVEAMYLRPNARGIFCLGDSRIPLANGAKKAESFNKIFCLDENYAEICRQIEPYTVRSGHLHAGEIRFYQGNPGLRSEDDSLVQLVERCQAVVLDLLEVLAESS